MASSTRAAAKSFSRYTNGFLSSSVTQTTRTPRQPSLWRRIHQTPSLRKPPPTASQAAATLRTAEDQQSLESRSDKQQKAAPQAPPSNRESTNPALSFPCLDAVEVRSRLLSSRAYSGPEPSYTTGAHKTFHTDEPLLLDWGGLLSEFDLAYETWGTLNSDASNAILLHTGLSASSHAHSTEENTKPGWWEKFIGPGAPLDTNKYFIICTNVLGGCYGSTGPASIDPSNGQRYATRFPILTMEDMVRAQFRLLNMLGIKKLYASVGSSMGGMQALAAGVHFPDRVERVASISGCARSHPYSIAMRHTQRQVLMVDPNWRRGFYYEDGVPPHAGMKLAREIATVTYRSGPEWEQRFGRRRADASKPPALCPDFSIETYLDHAGEKFCLEYDANSLLYISKAMDLFDLGEEHQVSMRARRDARQKDLEKKQQTLLETSDACTLTLPEQPYEEVSPASTQSSSGDNLRGQKVPREKIKVQSREPPADLVAGLSKLKEHPVLVMGVASDILFPAWQQAEVAEALKRSGNRRVTHVELGEDKSLFGHDTFLLDLENVGGALSSFLS